jgi:hypothetical protein
MATTLPSTLGIFKNNPQQTIATKAHQMLNALGGEGIVAQYIKIAGVLSPETHTKISSENLNEKLAGYVIEAQALILENQPNQENLQPSSSDHLRI